MNNCIRLCCAALLCLPLFNCGVVAQSQASAQPANVPVLATGLQSLLELKDAEMAAPPPVKGWKTANGTKVLFVRTTELPMLEVHVSLAAGSAKDRQQPGLAAATYALLNESVPGKDHLAFFEAMDGLGAEITMAIDQERASFSLRSLSDAQKRTQAIELFAQMLGKPHFTQASLARVKIEIGDTLKAGEQDSSQKLTEHMKTLLAPGTGYARSVFGTVQGLSSITLKDVQHFHQHAYAASTAQITLVGDVTLEQAQTLSVEISDALPIHKAQPSPALALAPIGTVMSSHLERAQAQTHLALAQYSVRREDPDYPAVHAAGLIFADGPNSRLMVELRQKRGLIYGAQMETRDIAGWGSTYIALETAPPFSQGTVALVQSLLADYLRDGPTPEELAQLKRRLTDKRALDSASNHSLLRHLREINRHDLPLDLDFTRQQIEKLTVGEIKAALNKHLPADRWHVATLGPTTEQQPLPPPSSDAAATSMCRAEAGFVAS